MELQNNQPWVLVRGAGDLATGVIVRLHRCGFKVAVTFVIFFLAVPEERGVV